MCSVCKGVTLTLSACDGRDGMVIEPKCKTWKCPECGRDRRKLWIARAAITIAMAGLWQVTYCSPVEFTALTKRLRKQGSVYYRIAFGTLSVVFHQPLIATRQHKPDSSKWLGSDAAMDEFSRIIMADGVTRVSCSRGLQRPVPPEHPRWKREAFKRKSVGEFNHLLTRLCIDHRIEPKRRFDGRLVDVILLRDFPRLQSASCSSLSILGDGTEGRRENLEQLDQCSDAGNGNRGVILAVRDPIRPAGR